MYMGTLYGRWPAAPVWATLLPLMDKRGRIDMAPQAIAGMTGWPLDLLQEGIRQLMEPDPASRTPGSDGRRLLPLSADRPWGWVAVNHSMYREKARKQFHNSQAVESGSNKERLQTRRDQTRPDATGSQKQTQTQKQTHKNPPNPPAGGMVVEGLDLQAWERWKVYRQEIRKPIREASMQAAMRKLAAFGSEQAAVVENSISEGYQGLFPAKTNGTAPTPGRTGSWMDRTNGDSDAVA